MNAKYKIALIEPSPVLSAGLKNLLSESGFYEVSYVFSTLQGFELRASHIQPDLVVVSPLLFDGVGRLNIRSSLQLSESVSLVGFITYCFEEKVVKQFDAVLDLYDNAQSASSKLDVCMRMGSEVPESSDNYNLSDRELDILVAVAKGMANKEIADHYDISVNTVITHRKNITRKTGIKSVSGLTVYALLNNFISQADVE